MSRVVKKSTQPVNHEKGYTERIPCSKSTKEKLFECKEVYKQNNRDARYRNVTFDEILNRVCDFYLEE